MRETWNLFKLITNKIGRQVWQINEPPQGWDSIEGKALLNKLDRDFHWNKYPNPNSADQVFRAQQTSANTGQLPAANSTDAARKAIDFYTALQAESGHWPGDYGGPHFLAPGLVIASYVTETPLPLPHQTLLKRYFLNHQNADGGWGLHLEGASTMFCTVLHYVALRILGMDSSKPAISAARSWIHQNGGATFVPGWGKFYLSLLGVYEWKGNHSLLPELWLLPRSLPIHPGNYWCHARMVYLPMGYCYGHRVTAKPTTLTAELRTELYTTAYEEIDWVMARDRVAKADLYYPTKPLLKVLNFFTNTYEKFALKGLRQKALQFTLDYINAEDDQTNYIDIGPVNQVINSVAIWHAYGAGSQQFKKHVERWFDYLWVAEDGMKMNGYNGSQLWDTAFAAQALLENLPQVDSKNTLAKAGDFIRISRIEEEVRDHKKFYRHDSVGGWPFSNAEHGWPITDCTAEGLKTYMLLHEEGLLNTNALMPLAKLEQSIDLILSFQNPNGGWASYELIRGPEWLEWLNPSAIFGNIMIEYPYVECSSASIQALLHFHQKHPGYRNAEIERALKKGIDFILSIQRPDGSWYGGWAVCFTYGTWFGVEALAQFHRYKPSTQLAAALDKACQFLASKQMTDGGWGEDFSSCVVKQYVQSQQSQVVNTAWALLSLMEAGYNNREVLDKGIQLLMSRQTPQGDFPQENISGVFNHSCGISYTNYRNIFPIWALGRYNRMVAMPQVHHLTHETTDII